MTFDDIWIDTMIAADNEFYTIYSNPEMPYMYDNNFMLLHYVPTLEEFKIIEQHLKDFHEEEHLQHLKYSWPENEGLTLPVSEYVEKEGYGLQMLELYTIQPGDFIPSSLHPDVSVSYVTEDTLSVFKKISFEQDIDISPFFAEQKQQLYDLQFDMPNIHFVLAFLGDEAVGGVTLIDTDETVEIDSLFVRAEWQQQGIGSAIQAFVMDIAGDRTVLLAADADDTPRLMYLKQGYKCQGFQLSIQKGI